MKKNSTIERLVELREDRIATEYPDFGVKMGNITVFSSKGKISSDSAVLLKDQNQHYAEQLLLL